MTTERTQDAMPERSTGHGCGETLPADQYSDVAADTFRLDGKHYPCGHQWNQHIVAVSFEVYAATREDAVRCLVETLSAAALAGNGPDPDRRVESWTTPNEPWADGSDDEGQRLVWTTTA